MKTTTRIKREKVSAFRRKSACAKTHDLNASGEILRSEIFSDGKRGSQNATFDGKIGTRLKGLFKSPPEKKRTNTFDTTSGENAIENMKNTTNVGKKQIAGTVEKNEDLKIKMSDENEKEKGKDVGDKENKLVVETTDSFDVDPLVDIELVFDDDDIVEFHPNIRLTEKTTLSNGNVDVVGCFSMFTAEGTKPLLTGLSLAEKLIGKTDPFAKRGGSENPGNFLFVSFLWDVVLKTQFLGDKTPHQNIDAIWKTFIPEMKEYAKEMDMTLFKEYIKWVNKKEADSGEKSNLSNSTCNWFDVPPILRILAPTYENLVEADYNPLRFFSQSVMKGLPHTVLMMPWYKYGLEKLIPGVQNSNEVSDE